MLPAGQPAVWGEAAEDVAVTKQTTTQLCSAGNFSIDCLFIFIINIIIY